MGSTCEGERCQEEPVSAPPGSQTPSLGINWERLKVLLKLPHQGCLLWPPEHLIEPQILG